MKTVKEVSEITGLSIRALRYYDEIGLLKPTRLTQANYRLYDDAALERLEQILFFRELEISLLDIKSILDNPSLDKMRLLGTQKLLLELKRNRLDGMIKGYGSPEQAKGAFISGVWDKTSRKEEDEQIYRQLSEAKQTGDPLLAHDAIQRLENHWKAIAKRDDVRLILLKLADSYLHDDSTNETDKRWGKGTSVFIGQAILRYYER